MEKSIEEKNISWQAAHALVESVVEAAIEMDVKVNVAVVDSGGHLAAFLRMPGSAFHSVDIAINKAYTAASFGLPTSGWQPVADSMSALSQNGLFKTERLVPCGGGLAIEDDGQRIGGIGVSGASEQEDEQLAQLALDTLNKN
ncbi:MAG: heme-binding protein [Gammaproteobacteria bacterium]|nr:heme-binding protein [Gammaproteobacteria bacterium]